MKSLFPVCMLVSTVLMLVVLVLQFLDMRALFML